MSNENIQTREANDRGFLIGDFQDCNGVECSIQESSNMFPSCIWLGINNPEVRYLEGQMPLFDLPDNVRVFGRMHLTQDQVANLLPLLQHFVSKGCLPSSSDEAKEYSSKVKSRAEVARELLRETENKITDGGWADFGDAFHGVLQEWEDADR